MTADILTSMHVMYRIRKTLQRDHMAYQRSLFMRLGLPNGLTEDDFAFCVGLLEEHGWLTVEKGERGRSILIFNKEYAHHTIHTPEEVIAHAMQQPSLTEVA
jgi:uncharacterized protein involved in type VI secretion and phage assembly